jgi:hypothetical protein
MGQQVANLYPVINGMVNIFNLTTPLTFSGFTINGAAGGALTLSNNTGAITIKDVTAGTILTWI